MLRFHGNSYYDNAARTIAVRTLVVFLQNQEVDSVKVKMSYEGTERECDVGAGYVLVIKATIRQLCPGVNAPVPILR